MNFAGALNTADIVLVLIIVGFAAYGWRRGFIRSAVGLLSLAASILLAYILRPVVSDLLNASPVHNAVLNSVSQRLNLTAAEETALLPKAVQSAVSAGADAAAGQMSAQLTGFVIDVLSFVIVLAAARLIIFIAARVLNVVSKLPVIGLVNRAAGMFIGTVKAIVLIYVLLALTGAAVPQTENNYLIYTIESSSLAKAMYVQNPICNFLSGGTDNFKK